MRSSVGNLPKAAADRHHPIDPQTDVGLGASVESRRIFYSVLHEAAPTARLKQLLADNHP